MTSTGSLVDNEDLADNHGLEKTDKAIGMIWVSWSTDPGKLLQAWPLPDLFIMNDETAL